MTSPIHTVRLQTQLASSSLRYEIPIDIHGRVTQGTPTCQVSQFQGASEARRSPGSLGDGQQHMAESCGQSSWQTGGRQGDEGSGEGIPGFPKLLGKVNVDILEGRLWGAHWHKHWPIRMKTAGHIGRSWAANI